MASVIGSVMRCGAPMVWWHAVKYADVGDGCMLVCDNARQCRVSNMR